MGNSQSIKDDRTIELDASVGKIYTPPSNTLSSLKASSSSEYWFRLPKNQPRTSSSFASTKTNTKTKTAPSREIPIHGNLGDRKFVTVDPTRCLLMHKDRTEAILLCNHHTETIHICSFTPPGENHRGGIPLFEWGRISKTRGKRRRFRECTLETPFDGTYSWSVPKKQRIDTDNDESKSRTVAIRSSARNSVCATLEETKSAWICRTTTCGVDPAMLACFVLALDAFQHKEQQPKPSDFALGFGSWEPPDLPEEHHRTRRRPAWCCCNTMHAVGLSSSSRSTMSSSEALPPITSFLNER